jgi:hypothetical protein
MVAAGLVALSGCAETETEPYPGVPTSQDYRQPDAGPMHCDLHGTWDIKLSESDLCAPKESAAYVAVTVGEDAGGSDVTSAAPVPLSPCGAYKQQAEVAADGCTVTLSSLATWCLGDRPQCADYQLTLHVQDDAAEVEGTYRSCWCGSPGAFGTKVDVVGHAIRR